MGNDSERTLEWQESYHSCLLVSDDGLSVAENIDDSAALSCVDKAVSMRSWSMIPYEILVPPVVARGEPHIDGNVTGRQPVKSTSCVKSTAASSQQLR